jgi:hypothetical protein
MTFYLPGRPAGGLRSLPCLWFCRVGWLDRSCGRIAGRCRMDVEQREAAQLAAGQNILAIVLLERALGRAGWTDADV